jgi:hypothetical protein
MDEKQCQHDVTIIVANCSSQISNVMQNKVPKPHNSLDYGLPSAIMHDRKKNVAS